MRVRVAVPASVANLGPGFDILALALHLQNTVRAEQRGGELTIDPGEHAPAVLRNPEENLVTRAYTTTCAELGVAATGVHFTCVNSIPIGRGMGSSAAAVLSGVLIASALHHAPWDENDILDRAEELEGHRDNVAAALLGGLAICSPGAPAAQLPVAEELHAVLMVPEHPFATAEARKVVPSEFSRNDAIFNAGRCALLVRALALGDHAGTPRRDAGSLASGRALSVDARRESSGGRSTGGRSFRRVTRWCRTVGHRAHPARSGADRPRDGARGVARSSARRDPVSVTPELRHACGCLCVTRVVQKYGGSSVATPIKLRRVARRIRESLESGTEVVVVVSAMGDTTDELIALAHRITADPPSREMDMLLSSGETITAPLLAMALHAAGTPAISLTGAQAGIRTSRAHRTARIVDIVPQRVLDELALGNVVVVAGFQGATEDMDVTTLGRGGSDTSAVALAVAVGADRCEIFTDVPGVHTADPRLVPDARVIPAIDYDEMLELASAGARVMHPRAVEIGEAYSMEIHVRSTFDNEPGTIIAKQSEMEIRQKVRAIAHETDVAKVTLLRVPDRPGVAAAIFGPFADAGIDIDIVLQNVGHDGATDLTFTIAESNLPKARRLLASVAKSVQAEGHHATAGVAKVTVIGSGLRGTPGIYAKIFQALAAKDINIQMIATSEIHVTCIIDRPRVRDAVRALHTAFELERI